MNIDEFCESVMVLRPQDMRAMNGAAAGIIGSSSSGADVMERLQRETINFTRLYKSDAKRAVVETKAKELEGSIMMALTVDAINEQTGDILTTALGQLMTERKE